MAVTFFSQSELRAKRIFLTHSTLVKVFPRPISELVMSVNLVYMSLIDSPSFMENNSNLCTKTEILDSFTLVVPSCVTSRICQISCAVVQFDTLLNSFLSKAQNNAFIALALVCIDFFSSWTIDLLV